MFELLTGHKIQEVHFDYLEEYPHYCQRFIPTACEGVAGCKPSAIIKAMGRMCASECLGIVIREGMRPALVYFLTDGETLKTRYIHFSISKHWGDIAETYNIGEAEKTRKSADFIQLIAGAFFKVKGYERPENKARRESKRIYQEECARRALRYRLYDIKRERRQEARRQEQAQDNATAQAIAQALEGIEGVYKLTF